jgi:hypothetical protein
MIRGRREEAHVCKDRKRGAPPGVWAETEISGEPPQVALGDEEGFGIFLGDGEEFEGGLV